MFRTFFRTFLIEYCLEQGLEHLVNDKLYSLELILIFENLSFFFVVLFGTKANSSFPI